MTKFYSTALVLAALAVICLAQRPVKLFDVRNGGTTATTIEYRDATAKQQVIDAFAAARGYQDTIPDPANPGQVIANPQTKQQFFNAALTQFLRDTYKTQTVKATLDAQTKAVQKTVDDDLPDSR